MPTSKTIYEAFDGEEFPNEEEAKKYEERVVAQGAVMRMRFLKDENYLRHADTRFIDFIKSYSDEEAWKILKSLRCASFVMDFGYSDDWCCNTGHC